MTLWVFLGGDDFVGSIVETGVVEGSDNYDAKVGDSAVVFSEQDGLVFGPFRIQSTADSDNSDSFGGEGDSSFRVKPFDVVSQANVEGSVYCDDLASGGAVDEYTERFVKRRLGEAEEEFSLVEERPEDTNASSSDERSLSLKDISKSSDQIDARKQDFSGEDHGRLRLDRAKLRGADLSHTNLSSDSGSIGTTFTGAELQDVDFRGANLVNTDFTGAELDRADFTGADLSGATLSGNLTECKFSGATMNGATLSDATVAGAEFVGAQMRRADFRGTKLTGAHFERTDLRNIETSAGDQFERLSLDRCDLRETTIAGVHLDGTTFRNCDLRGANLTNPELDNVTFLSSDVTRGDFREQSAEGLDFSNSTLSDAKFQNVELEDARFTGSRLNDAKFSGADVSSAVMSDVKASDADFEGANLERVAFSEAELFGASLIDAALYGTILQSARIGGDTRFHDDSDERYVIYDERSEQPCPEGVVSEPAPVEKAMSVYQTLEAVMEGNAYSAASRRYFLNRKAMERRNHRRLGNWWGWTVNCASRLSCGYGESFKTLLVWAGFLVFGLGVLYPALGLTHERYGSLTYTETGLLQAIGHGSQFSLSAFTGLGYGPFDVGLVGEVVATFETAGGVLFFALLVFVLTRRFTR
ncbi:pentapeptide repeat-containing protein [Halomarina rubra]|uniref:Pentapeptide repeat-containing protein n=1 Tax=Halomarina rubra TaxID=2071873 RepID=A0ABD6AV93_9EURY|nr:pentapeptide repeat-containing protein [Halomarina rubra]